MRTLLVIALVAAGASAASAQEEDREYLKKRLEEKRKELHEAEKELGQLYKELRKVWAPLPPDMRPYARKESEASMLPPPLFFSVSAGTLWTDWDDGLGLGNGNGFNFSVIPGLRREAPEGRGGEEAFYGVSFLPFSLRYWRAEDERADGDVDVFSYRIVGGWAEYVSPEDIWGFNASAVWGLTRYASNASGGDSDWGHGFTFEGRLVFRLIGPLRFVAGVSWDLINTSFNQDHTDLTNTYSALLSLELTA